MDFIRRHKVLVFFVLAYALSWGAVPFDSFFAPGALIAALVVVSLTEGIAGLKELGGRLIRWRVGWVWYVVAIAVPLLIHLVTVSANLGLGADRISTDQFTPWYGLLLVFGMNLVMGGPMSEEPSFRGFAQARLQDGRTPLAATAILAVAITGWHLPLFVISAFGLQPVEAVATVAVTFWYAWLFNHAGGSVLITLIAHATEGSIDLNSLWSSDADTSRVAWVYTATWCVFAIGLLVADRRFWLGSPRAEATEVDPRRPEPVVSGG